MAVNFTFNSNVQVVLSEFEKKVERGFEAIGIEAEKDAKIDVPVDSGRLKNSITFATQVYHSPGNSTMKAGETPADPPEYATQETPEKNALYLGSNVSYAEPVETLNRPHTTGKAHFLRDALAQHCDRHRKLMKKSLETD